MAVGIKFLFSYILINLFLCGLKLVVVVLKSDKKTIELSLPSQNIYMYIYVKTKVLLQCVEHHMRTIFKCYSHFLKFLMSFNVFCIWNLVFTMYMIFDMCFVCKI